MFEVYLVLSLLLVAVFGDSPGKRVSLRADELLKKVNDLLNREETSIASSPSKSFLRGEDGGDEGLSTGAIIGIGVGGGVLLLLIGYLIYRYKKWVPRTKTVARAINPSAPTSPEQQRLITSPTSPTNATIAAK
jgi:hypothetical protein